MKVPARRLTKLENAVQLPARYVVLHEFDFENVEALDAEAERLQAESHNRLTIIKVIFSDDWRPAADKTINLSWDI